MRRPEYSCVEPMIRAATQCGETRGLDPGLQKRWRLHLEVCHACREEVAGRGAVTRLISRGVGVPTGAALSAPALRMRRRRYGARGAWAGAGVSLAAGFALVFLMSPDQKPLLERGLGGADRGDIVFWIERPLEGEILAASGGKLEWTAVDDASSYRISVETLDGDPLWSGTATASKIDLPSESEAPGTYLAVVEPIPRGLVAEDHADVQFTRGDWRGWLGYRLMHAATPSLLPIALALILAGVAVFRRA